ncbi:hypothetical protein ABZV80_40925 [Streptomyces sp. NPDC005132]|uniref:hypothetical protein n=1 Tax=Streptomyces sp. NPDC005132 TaxID=3154294 RepID=UPI0033AEBA58
MTIPAIPADERTALAALLGNAKTARDSLVQQLARTVRDCAEHDHTTQREDLYCLNLISFMGERMAPVLRRLLDAEAEAERLNASLRHAVTTSAAAAIRSVHQRGHEFHLPLELLEFLTGGVETAAAAGAEEGALPRDAFTVVVSASGGGHAVAEEILCTQCNAITTQAGFDGQGWTLARLDLLADRHRCLPRVPADVADSVLDEIQDDTCVEFCDEDPKTACSLSGRRHVHPASQGPGFGPCPVHPDAPGDI